MFDKKKYPNVADGHQYALDIISGEITSNIYVKAACTRYINDLKEIKENPDCSFYFRPEAAERYLRLVQKFHHAVGQWETALIIYEPWQKFIFMNLKGFYSHRTKFIRFRTALIDLARGNGKSVMAAQMALYECSLDENLNGNRVYCAAVSRDQAKEVLNGAQIMASKNKSYLKSTGVDVRAHEVLHPKSNSYIKAISAQANSLDGKIGKLVITDELHAMQRKTFEVLDSGQSKRRDSLLLSITTAGYANDGIGYSQRSYAMKVALGQVADETFFSFICCLDKDDDWFDPTVWIKANPNMGVSVDEVNFAAKAKKAKENPEDAANFKIKHLNMYLDSLNQFFSTNKWVDCRDTNLKLEDFKGKSCYAAIDLATKIDIVSICYIFLVGGIYYLFFKNYCPQARIDLVRNRNYLRYVEEGDLISMPGDVINIPKLQEIILEDAKMFKFISFFYDPWNATEMATRLSAKSIEMVEFRMNTGNLSEPMKKWRELMMERKCKHNTKAMLEWCISNVVAKVDANDNVYPRKDNEALKIDPCISAIMCIAGHLQDTQKESVYETRGLIVM